VVLGPAAAGLLPQTWPRRRGSFILGGMNPLGIKTFDACVVCGERDERALATLKLGNGGRVVVCGSHDLIYRRCGRVAFNEEELRTLARDRRQRTLRRDHGDELGAQLAAAFSPDRRASGDRRR
jgi:hypothetical protein